MKLSEIDVIRRPVQGYPQLTVREPTIAEGAEIAVKLEGFTLTNVEDEEVAKTACWFLNKFVADTEGNPVEGVDPETVFQELPSGLLLACVKACTANISGDDSDSPE